MEDAEDDIAVVGIGCNFPGGEGLDNFWQVLLERKNCVVDIPAERFDTTFWYDADESKPGKTQTTKAALIEGGSLWKTSCLFPVPKTPRPSGPQDYRLVALMSHIMKTLERLVLEQLRPMVRPFTHLDKPASTVRVMSFDFSSAFNTCVVIQLTLFFYINVLIMS